MITSTTKVESTIVFMKGHQTAVTKPGVQHLTSCSHGVLIRTRGLHSQAFRTKLPRRKPFPLPCHAYFADARLRDMSKRQDMQPVPFALRKLLLPRRACDDDDIATSAHQLRCDTMYVYKVRAGAIARCVTFMWASLGVPKFLCKVLHCAEGRHSVYSIND